MKQTLSFLFLLFCMGSLPAQSARMQPSASRSGERVVLIHGFMQDYRTMLPVYFTLRRECFAPLLWDYPSRGYTIEQHGADLASFLSCLAAERPGEPIHFATHSVGALVLRAALNNPCCPQEAKCGRAVLLAPSNQGSKLARSYFGNPLAEWIVGPAMGRELMTYSPQNVECCIGPFPHSMGVLVIAGTQGIHAFCEPNDGWVSLEETELSTPYVRVVYPFSHGQLLTCKTSLCSLIRFLLCQ